MERGAKLKIIQKELNLKTMIFFFPKLRSVLRELLFHTARKGEGIFVQLSLLENAAHGLAEG